MNREEYLKQIESDILENYSPEEIVNNPEETADQAYYNDAVTGISSGSFYFSRYQAFENAMAWDALDIISEMLDIGFFTKDEFAERYRDQDFEWFDVCIRCFLFEEAFTRAEKTAKTYMEMQDQQPEV